MTSLMALLHRLVGIESNVTATQPPAFRSRLRVSIGAVLTVLVLGVTVLIGISTLSGTPEEQIPTNSVNPSIEPIALTSDTLLVHVGGEVHKPGLYELVSDSRVVDAVMAAGGAVGDIEACGINLARKLSDGEDITIHTNASTCSPASAEESGLVSLNTATTEQLEALPGVGPSLAGKILSWRQAHGAFTDLNQLDEVPGIGPKLLEQLTPDLTL